MSKGQGKVSKKSKHAKRLTVTLNTHGHSVSLAAMLQVLALEFKDLGAVHGRLTITVDNDGQVYYNGKKRT